jgi:hypothetical protein
MATFVAITMMGWWFPGRTLMTVIPLFPFLLTIMASGGSGIIRAVVTVSGLVSPGITLALVQATRRGEVTLAVDPFDMQFSLFRIAGMLFPQYTDWTAETIMLTVVWLFVGLASFVALSWRYIAPAIGKADGRPLLAAEQARQPRSG